ncbi:uncharacterized protein PV07_07406 [Cladophialophora immunda]|uniref:Uncharacterized protein n=1 Tax=Cladophialophora immunda TaxID=569365 RepID=A0A0D1ZI95_9EURO|nr:uncharacterized protein PV07_07406 [Cladophialophora immunda]KIW27686.1 hypothetical protein PV07_07406 [Cladophialophora immunda]
MILIVRELQKVCVPTITSAIVSQTLSMTVKSKLHLGRFLKPSTLLVKPFQLRADETSVCEVKQLQETFGIAVNAVTSTIQSCLQEDALFVDTRSVSIVLMLNRVAADGGAMARL